MLHVDELVKSKNKMKTEPISVVLVGVGHRTSIYASYSEENPQDLKVVGIAELDEVRRNKIGDKYNVPEEYRFESVDEFVNIPKFADAVINGTMDDVHVETTIPILKAGYDVLLEKPIGISEEEILQLLEVANQYKRNVMICHVLRYAPFYTEIKKRIIDGEIGDVVNIQSAENIGYDHMAASYIRGKWGNKEKSKSSMLLAKCCHDIDLITWFMSGIKPSRVSSFGSLSYFKPENAPKGAGKRCLVDCKIESICEFSAKNNYIDQGRWGWYAWRGLEHLGSEPTLEQKIESLKTDNPYGRCVWDSDNDVVDRQSVIIEFNNGTTASHNLVGGTSKPCRNIHIVGTKGEIEGCMEDGYFIVRHPDLRKGHRYSEKHVDVSVKGDGHGGGDLRLVADFVNVLQGNKPSISSTTLEDSINGHLIVFAADRANEENKVVNMKE